MAKTKGVLHGDDLVMMVAIVARLDPDRYPSPTAKATIYKCKALSDDPPDTLVVL